ncbi:MAG: 3-isopropylmalate dehydratase small subunit [Bacteroidota bacterium]
MEQFTSFSSQVVPLPNENVDTDQIIPARFLKATTREGFGKNLFRDWRYKSNGEPNTEFVLNQSTYSGKVLVAGKNFGCGSSREHAAWSIYDFGFRVVVSSFFADIFRNNALNNGLLPVQISEDFLQTIFEKVEEDPTLKVHVSLEEEQISIPSLQLSEKFPVNPFNKNCLLKGYDNIDFLVSLQKEINAFEVNRI